MLTPLPGTVLNVNDSDAARYLVSRQLRSAGFEVVEATTGAGALEQLERAAIDVAVLDIRLPDIDGFEVCRRIRSNRATEAIKVVHTSATFVGTDNKIQSLEQGGDAYLSQPFEREELVAVVRSLMRLAIAERAMRETAERLREADRRKDEFLAMLAHELRNPLAAIVSSLPLLERRAAHDDVEQRARDVIRRQTNHLGHLVDDLLDVARVTQGKIELAREPVDLVAVLRRVVATIRQAKTDPRRQALTAALPEGRIVVRGDATRLEQLFTNLLDNASKYSAPGGRIAIAVEVAAAASRVRVRIVDDGIGIDPRLLPTIFGLFAQAPVALARSNGGLGIGLTLVKALAELHGGSCVARSDGAERGSEFEVDLPLESTDAAPEPARAPGPARTQNGRRLLIVEDNVDAQEMLATLCELLGHDVHTADDGPSALVRAEQVVPEVALVDIGIPGLDGYEVARRLRARFGDRLLLVALTGYGAPEQRQAAWDAGFDEHVVKPIDPARLEQLLATAGPAAS
jgi:signal transduction histidine kinase